MFNFKKKNKTKSLDFISDPGFDSFFRSLGIDRNTPNLSEATYFACMKILSESLAKLPCKILERKENKGIIERTDHAWYNAIKYKPNPYMTATTFWSTVEMNRNEYGNSYVWIDTNLHQLWVLDPRKMRIWLDDAKAYDPKTPTLWYIYTTNKGTQQVFRPEEILHFKTSNTFDGIMGISVATQLATTIQGAKDSQKVINNSYKNNMVGKTVVQYTGELSPDKVKEFVKRIKSYISSEDETRDILPVPLGTTVTPLATRLVDSQYAELKRYTALQIASAFGIKPNQIGDYSKSSYASSEQQQLDFYVGTMHYILKQYEEELTEKLLSAEEIENEIYFKFNVNALMRIDFKTQIETLTKGVNSFLITPNEAREMLDLPSVDGGDKIIGNGASIPIDLVGSQYTNLEGKGGE